LDKKRILVVDDDGDIVQFFKRLLERGGSYEVLGITDSRDVIAQLHAFRPDVIVLDLLMPHVGGLEVCQELNDDPIGQVTPVIITSALWKDTDKFKAFKLGITCYLVKPIDKDMLVAAIENVLRLKEQTGGDPA
jgi:two-component system alkaline phosphatase synthesis response regulator PhoP